MNNSHVCSTKFRGVDTPKKKYKTWDAAYNAAKTINKLPTTIHVFGEYKCLTCHYFHIGRTNKVIVRENSVFTQAKTESNVTPSDLEVDTTPFPVFPIFNQTNNENPIEVPNLIEVEQPKEPHDDFNWDNDIKKIEKIDSYYDKLILNNSLI